MMSPENHEWMLEDTFTIRPWIAVSVAVSIILFNSSLVRRKCPKFPISEVIN